MFKFKNSSTSHAIKSRQLTVEQLAVLSVLIPGSFQYESSLQLISGNSMHFVKPSRQVRVSICKSLKD